MIRFIQKYIPFFLCKLHRSVLSPIVVDVVVGKSSGESGTLVLFPRVVWSLNIKYDPPIVKDGMIVARTGSL